MSVRICSVDAVEGTVEFRAKTLRSLEQSFSEQISNKKLGTRMLRLLTCLMCVGLRKKIQRPLRGCIWNDSRIGICWIAAHMSVFMRIKREQIVLCFQVLYAKLSQNSSYERSSITHSRGYSYNRVERCQICSTCKPFPYATTYNKSMSANSTL